MGMKDAGSSYEHTRSYNYTSRPDQERECKTSLERDSKITRFDGNNKSGKSLKLKLDRPVFLLEKFALIKAVNYSQRLKLQLICNFLERGRAAWAEGSKQMSRNLIYPVFSMLQVLK